MCFLLSESKQSDDGIGEYSSLYRKKIPFTLKFFIKDIEISRKDFILLFLMFSSLIFMLFGQFALEQIITNTEGTSFPIYYLIIIGLFTGLVLSLILNDRINNPMTFLYYIILISFLTYIFQVVFLFHQPG